MDEDERRYIQRRILDIADQIEVSHKQDAEIDDSTPEGFKRRMKLVTQRMVTNGRYLAFLEMAMLNRYKGSEAYKAALRQKLSLERELRRYEEKLAEDLTRMVFGGK